MGGEVRKQGKGRRPIEWPKVAEKVWKGIAIEEIDKLEMVGLETVKKAISVALGEREGRNTQNEATG